MKNSKMLWRALMILAFLGTQAFPREVNQVSGNMSKAGSIQAANGPSTTLLNINNFQIWVDKDGFFPWSGSATGTAGSYPKGTAGTIFAEGMLWGAKVSDGKSPRLRVNGATYATGMKAGKVLYDASGAVTGASDELDRHVWRVRNDYVTANLASDAAGFYVTAVGDVTPAQIQAVYDQYDYDWNNWPAADGAPYQELDGIAGYKAATWDVGSGAWINGDIPGEPGATQTIWLVANDIPYADGSEVSANSYGSPAIGIEMQLTLWAYGFASSNPLGNMLFKRARLIYTGTTTTPATARLDTVYFTQWSDPDLGNYSDDYVGNDTTLSLGFVYNGNTLDHDYNGSYGLAVPAAGYDFLQGPIINSGGNTDTLGMTSFGYFGAGSAISDPDLEEYAGTLQWFNLMEGFLPRPEYPEQTPWTNTITGDITKFPLAGDPVAGTGDLDGVALPPGDRRLLLNTGPFQMALGDTQDVVIALIGGLGGDNLSSITVLKYYDIYAQFAYDNGFSLPNPPSKPVVEAFGGDKSIMLNWGSNASAVAATEEVVQKGFEFEGYKIYQLPSATANASDGVLLGEFDRVDGVITITEDRVDPVSGLVLEYPAHIGSDNGISRYMTIREDKIRNRPISNDRPYYFGVSAYSYLPDNANSPFKSLESGLSVVEVYPQKPVPELTYYTNAGDTLAITKGPDNKSDGAVYPVVLNPAELQDAAYEVNFNQDLTWNLLLDGDTVLAAQTNQSGDGLYQIIHGTIVKVLGPALEGKSWSYEAGTGTGDRWFSGAGDGELLYGGAYLGPMFTGSSIAPADFKKVEIRWGTIEETGVGPGDPYTVVTTDSNASRAASYNTWGAGHFLAIIDIPFSAWDVSGATPRQLDVVIRDRDENGRWDMNYVNDDGSVDLQYNYAWILDTDYDEGAAWDPTAGGEDFMAQVDVDGGPVQWALWLGPRGSREFFQDNGTLTLVPNAVNSPADRFLFTTKAPVAKTVTNAEAEMINVFPNPYYGFQPLETSRGGKYVTFNHLPQKATIRLFNLGGVMVRVIPKDDATQYAKWDLTNQFGYPVASGIYIAYIEMPASGQTKILKLALVQEEQILQNY